jgi:catechol 2,3-dioxygenase-like lactoylglutathione lyase family enzyme
MKTMAVIAQLRTTDLGRSIRFYVDVLGFELAFVHGDFYAGLRAGGQMLHLKRVDTPDPSIPFVVAGDHLHLYIETDDADSFAAAVVARGGALARPMQETAWGTREFVLRDDQGHTVHVAARLGDATGRSA